MLDEALEMPKLILRGFARNINIEFAYLLSSLQASVCCFSSEDIHKIRREEIIFKY